MFGFLRLFINWTAVKEICGRLLQSLIKKFLNCKKCSWLFVLRYVSLIQSWKVRSLLYPHNPIGPIKALTVFYNLLYAHLSYKSSFARWSLQRKTQTIGYSLVLLALWKELDYSTAPTDLSSPLLCWQHNPGTFFPGGSMQKRKHLKHGICETSIFISLQRFTNILAQTALSKNLKKNLKNDTQWLDQQPPVFHTWKGTEHNSNCGSGQCKRTVCISCLYNLKKLFICSLFSGVSLCFNSKLRHLANQRLFCHSFD